MPTSQTVVLTALSIAAFITSPASARQAPGASGAPPQTAAQLANQADRQKMMDLLNITTLRRGADGSNKQSPFYANYDESKANPYPTLPDPLVMKNGKKVTSAAMWPARRAEIVEDFDREIYGRVPAVTPKVTWEVVKVVNEKNGDVTVITKTLLGHVDNSAYPAISVNIQLSLSTPANATGPVPVMMYLGPSAPGFPGPAFGFGGPLGGSGRGGFGGSGRGGLAFGGSGGGRGRGPAGPSWQQQVLAKGWGYATISTGSIQADNGAGLTAGIIGLVNKGQPRKPDDWGALRAWAWGASRALDYFETDKAVNAKMVGLEGHSRWGKGTVVAMAYDTRFAIAFVSSSGEGGARIHRRYFGEMVENVTAASEYHWMAGNFLKYGGPLTANDMPVDAHELVALCAPRPVFISGGAVEGDGWQDPKGMFLAAAGAQPVYKLLGKKDMGTMEFPPIETALIDGDVAYREHSGGHTDVPNWPTFITFASRYLR
jgi:hypothetical protein